MSAGEPSVLDAALDRTVVLSYSRIGYVLRCRHFAPGDLRRMDGQVALVTGASSGIGLAAAVGFAGLGATVWIVARDRERGERARDWLRQQSGSAAHELAVCDLSDLGSVRGLAASLRRSISRLDVLVHNAAVLTHEHRLSPDGIELTMATNVVGPHLLTHELEPLLRRGSRVVNVSSGGMYSQRLKLVLLAHQASNTRGTALYAQSKRMLVILSELWADRLRERGVAVNAMHPGWVDTPGLDRSLPAFHRISRRLLRTPEQGADTIVWLGCSRLGGDSSGGFWFDRARRPTHYLPFTRETAAERDRLWLEVERLAGTAG